MSLEKGVVVGAVTGAYVRAVAQQREVERAGLGGQDEALGLVLGDRDGHQYLGGVRLPAPAGGAQATAAGGTGGGRLGCRRRARGTPATDREHLDLRPPQPGRLAVVVAAGPAVPGGGPPPRPRPGDGV